MMMMITTISESHLLFQGSIVSGSFWNFRQLWMPVCQWACATSTALRFTTTRPGHGSHGSHGMFSSCFAWEDLYPQPTDEWNFQNDIWHMSLIDINIIFDRYVESTCSGWWSHVLTFFHGTDAQTLAAKDCSKHFQKPVVALGAAVAKESSNNQFMTLGHWFLWKESWSRIKITEWSQKWFVCLWQNSTDDGVLGTDSRHRCIQGPWINACWFLTRNERV